MWIPKASTSGDMSHNGRLLREVDGLMLQYHPPSSRPSLALCSCLKEGDPMPISINIVVSLVWGYHVSARCLNHVPGWNRYPTALAEGLCGWGPRESLWLFLFASGSARYASCPYWCGLSGGVAEGIDCNSYNDTWASVDAVGLLQTRGISPKTKTPEKL